MYWVSIIDLNEVLVSEIWWVSLDLKRKFISINLEPCPHYSFKFYPGREVTLSFSFEVLGIVKVSTCKTIFKILAISVLEILLLVLTPKLGFGTGMEINLNLSESGFHLFRSS